MIVKEQSKLDAQLLKAAKSGSVVTIAELLDAGGDINGMSPESYQTVIQIAITNSTCCSIVLFLLQYQNINIHVRDQQGGSLLHNAVRKGCGDCTRRLLDAGLSMTDEDVFRHSVFRYAVEPDLAIRPLLRMLRHATNRGMEIGAITALKPNALYRLCSYRPIFRTKASLLVRFGWSLLPHIENDRELLLHILKEEDWLLKELIQQPGTIKEIRSKDTVWDKVLQAALRKPGKNPAVVLAFLRAGIRYQHLRSEIRELATREKDDALLKFLDGETVWCEEPASIEEEPYVLALNAHDRSILQEHDAVATEVTDELNVTQDADSKKESSPNDTEIADIDISDRVPGPE